MKTVKIIELCAGTGGFSVALKKNGETILANDILPISKVICELNRITDNFLLQDLTQSDFQLDKPREKTILTAGFPCQPFSIAGLRKGFDDSRSNVFLAIVNIIKRLKPTVILLENVKNLLSHDKGQTFNIIKQSLEKEGYKIKHQIMNTCEYSFEPQNRERVYIVGFKQNKHFDKFQFPEKIDKRKPICEYLEKEIPEKYYYSPKSKIYDILKQNIIKKDSVYQYRRVYVRENKKNLCPTLTANMGTGGHNVPIILDDKGIRKLTPRECFNLQGFPQDYKLPKLADSKLYFLAGNAISIGVVERIGENIIKAINPLP